jgi:hypothetical protein
VDAVVAGDVAPGVVDPCGVMRLAVDVGVATDVDAGLGDAAVIFAH